MMQIRRKKSRFFFFIKLEYIGNSSFFPHRFFDKTKNEWEHKENFMKVAGKYDVVLMDYSADEKVKNKW